MARKVDLKVNWDLTSGQDDSGRYCLAICQEWSFNGLKSMVAAHRSGFTNWPVDI